VSLPRLVLASTSPYRAELLGRLGLPFERVRPEVDEAVLPGESPEALVRRLAQAKARAGAAGRADALVIGSDQVAVIDGQVLGKPGSHARAMAQLRAASGRRVTFLTGLALADTRRAGEAAPRGGPGSAEPRRAEPGAPGAAGGDAPAAGASATNPGPAQPGADGTISVRTEVVPFPVRFRSLEDAEIEAYLRAEQPYDSAGAFKSEGLGIALFEALEGDDPTALVGLPLIRLCAMLRAAGLDPLLHR
jgi:septum formation protein